MARISLILGITFVLMFVAAIPLHRLLLMVYAPKKYADLKRQGRFPGMPDTWEDFWDVWTQPPNELASPLIAAGALEHPRVLYGRFTDRYLMPIPYLRLFCTLALYVGLILIGIWGVAQLF